VSELRFDDQVIAVTGAGHGIGRAYALELARRGAAVVVNDLGAATDGTGEDGGAAAAVVAEIESAGGRAVANVASVTDPDGAASIVLDAVDGLGRLDAVIANAGILRDRSFAKLDLSDAEPVVDVHLWGSWHLAQAAFRHFRDADQSGRILLTTSASGLFGNFGQSSYAAAKMAVAGLVRVLAIEGERSGITANAISPIAGTRLTGREQDADAEDPMSPARVVAMAVALCHPSCPTTGELYLAGGGWYARAAVGLTPGWFDEAGTATAEDLLERWDEVQGGELTEPGDAMGVGRLLYEKQGQGDG